MYSEVIFRLRKERGKTQDELGMQLGVDRSYLSKLESGERPVLAKHFAKLAKVLGGGVRK